MLPENLLEFVQESVKWKVALKEVAVVSKQSSPDKLLGQVLHNVIKDYVTFTRTDAIENFIWKWERYKSWKLAYEIGDDWEALRDIGVSLLSRFLESYKNKGIVPYLCERQVLYTDDGNTSQRQPDFIGIKEDGRVIIVDFKFGKEWTQEMVDADMQLTEYAGAVAQFVGSEDSIQVAVCNLVKEKCEVKWLFGERKTSERQKVRREYVLEAL